MNLDSCILGNDYSARRRNLQPFAGVRPHGVWFLAGFAAAILCTSAQGKALAGELSIISPKESATTVTEEFINILGNAEKGAQVTVQGEKAIAFHTGLFVRDRLPLNLGENAIQITAICANGSKEEKILKVTRTAKAVPTPVPSWPLFIQEKTLTPNEETFLLPGEFQEVAFRGAPGNQAQYQAPTGKWVDMTEERDSKTGAPSGWYRGYYCMADAETTASSLRVRLSLPAEKSAAVSGNSNSPIELQTKGSVSAWPPDVIRLARVKDNFGFLVAGLHEVRLGGPYLAELPQGTLLRVIGQRGEYYHVRLCPSLDAWIASEQVEWAPQGTALPHLYFTSISVTGDENFDTVTIPYSSRVPFAVRPSIGPNNRARIEVDFFGAHSASTWNSHRPSARVIREVSAEQIATDLLRVRVDLTLEQLWGYRAEATTTSLQLKIRRAPALAQAPNSPVKGLTIALEAGHGGRNSGAMGWSGAPEQSINRMTVDELAAQFEAKGAKIVQCRPGNENPSLMERRKKAEEANADLFISVHANSAGSSKGFLSVSGTSTYYKHSFDRDFSEAIHARLLEKTKLGDFGNVGNFNYTPIRTIWMPAMLVEQAFMSCPEDEAKMLDPQFRKIMAEAIVLGAEDFLKSVSKQSAK